MCEYSVFSYYIKLSWIQLKYSVFALSKIDYLQELVLLVSDKAEWVPLFYFLVRDDKSQVNN